MDILAFPNVGFEDVLPLLPALESVDDPIRRQVEKDALYANYIIRQQREIEALKRDEEHAIPAGFDFNAVNGLSNELKQKLILARPSSLSQASRIDGMTPAGLALLLAVLRKDRKRVNS